MYRLIPEEKESCRKKNTPASGIGTRPYPVFAGRTRAGNLQGGQDPDLSGLAMKILQVS